MGKLTFAKLLKTRFCADRAYIFTYAEWVDLKTSVQTAFGFSKTDIAKKQSLFGLLNLNPWCDKIKMEGGMEHYVFYQ